MSADTPKRPRIIKRLRTSGGRYVSDQAEPISYVLKFKPRADGQRGWLCLEDGTRVGRWECDFDPSGFERFSARDPVARPCVHLGADTGERLQCDSCRGSTQFKVFECAVHGQCTIGRKPAGVASCWVCSSYSAGEGAAAVGETGS
jgi:hypothetical protein